MAPLSPTNTGRLLFDYSANGRQHVVQFRYPGTGGPPESGFVELAAEFMEGMAPFMPTDAVGIGWRYAPFGTNVTNPIPAAVPVIAGAYTPHTSDAPAFISFVGRSADGRRNRITVLGVGYDPAEVHGTADNYRLTSLENADVAAAIADLIDLDPVSISGLTTVWKAYANLGYNAYWQRAVRS